MQLHCRCCNRPTHELLLESPEDSRLECPDCRKARVLRASRASRDGRVEAARTACELNAIAADA